METLYYRHGDGTLSQADGTDRDTHVPPTDATEITGGDFASPQHLAEAQAADDAASGRVQQVYVRHGDGSVSAVEVLGRGEHVAQPGDVEIGQEEYERIRAEHVAARESHVADLLEGDEQRMRGDYEALIVVGIPEGTARRLSGYQGA